jgi:putative intracellular protease/amidase
VSTKRKAFLLVFDGFADWEPAHALCEINRSGKFDVVTAGFDRTPVVTMGGLKLIPDVTIEAVDPVDVGIFLLPGGDMWQQRQDERVEAFLRRLHSDNILIGAICGATLEIARAGLTHHTRHTSNSKAYLKTFVPDYRDEDLYVEELAVTDSNVITASGLGSLEFAREVIQQLDLYRQAEAAMWFDMFKRGVVPPSMA